jgi:predicted glycogen debranching enzyme
VNASLTIGREICGELGQALRREWLVTNGLGGFAAGTVAGCQTRRYHGLLIAATAPPGGRVMFLVDLDATVQIGAREYELACHEYGGGEIHPAGFRLLESFQLDGSVPTWTYALGAARLIKRVFMARERNSSFVQYALERGEDPVSLRLRALCTARDYHWQRRGAEGFYAEPIANGCRIATVGSDRVLSLSTDGGEFHIAPDYHWNLFHREEAERGLDSLEDLYSPGFFELRLEPGSIASIIATIEPQPESAAQALAQLRDHEATLTGAAGGSGADWIDRLVLSADQFIVSRRRTAGQGALAHGATVIAGYPWFGDWGRDTMIALPGLTLATGRAAICAQILRTFAQYLDRGLVPNRFADDGVAPAYNTADATLWFLVALENYLRATDDLQFARELWPMLLDIIDWHQRGTRFGIAMDPNDGLLRAGELGVQLTWMDAKVGDWVVTPRIGKPVEINALWCNALQIVGAIAERLMHRQTAERLKGQARTATASFRDRFWYAQGRYLYDLIDGPESAADASLRPNQLLALALPHALLDPARARRVLEACERELLSSYGMRTLEPADPRYLGRYQGDQWQRDRAYHQGTVWAWLLGAFARAHYALYRDRERALSYLAPLEQHLIDACIGQVSEIFDGDPPHRPRGCFAQAWSVAEILHAWHQIHGALRSTGGS